MSYLRNLTNNNDAFVETRLKSFPNNVYLKNVLLRNVGSATSIDVSLEAGFVNKEFYNNFQNYKKNDLKFKIFGFQNQNTLTNIVQAESKKIDIKELEKILSLQTEEIPTFDGYIKNFKGTRPNDSAVITLELPVKENNIANLIFTKSVTSPIIGLLFYYDADEYALKNNLDVEFINKNLTRGIIHFFKTSNTPSASKYTRKFYKFVNSENIAGPINAISSVNLINYANLQNDLLLQKVAAVETDIYSVIQDLRKPANIFKNTEFLDKINVALNYEKNFTKTLSQSFDAWVRLNAGIRTLGYFSNLYQSRDEYGNSNLIFFFNFQRFLKQSSIGLGDFFDPNSITDDSTKESPVFNTSKIVSVKILRRQVGKNVENVETLITTAADSNNDIIENKTDNCIIRQANITNLSDLKKKFVEIEVVDKDLYKKGDSIYNYGVEIQSKLNYYDIFYNIREKLLNYKQDILQYLSQTNKKLVINSNFEQSGYYDYLSDSFTESFIPEVFTVGNPSLKTRLENSVEFLNKILDFFGFLSPRPNPYNSAAVQQIIEENIIDRQGLSEALKAMLDPNSANQKTISYYLQIYEQVISIINKQLDNSKNFITPVQYWFPEEIDASIEKDVGYTFIGRQNKDGLIKLTSNQFISEISNNRQKYVSPGVILTQSHLNFIGPSKISIRDKKLVLDSSVSRADTSIFTEIEAEIKKYIFFKKALKEINSNSKSSILNQNQQNISIQLEQLLNNFSFKIENLLEDSSDEQKIKQGSKQDSSQINPQINPLSLQLALIKGLTNNTDISLLDNLKKFPGGRALNNSVSREEQITNYDPYQVTALTTNTDVFFGNAEDPTRLNIKYLSDVNENSKFLLLYNTIHIIEYLTFDSVSNAFLWKKFEFTDTTSSIRVFNELMQNQKKSILCKISAPYKRPAFAIDKFEEIALPIYDKYFIVTPS